MNPNSRSSWRTIALILIVLGVLALALGGYLTSLSRLALGAISPAQSWLVSRYQAFRDLINAPDDLTNLRQRNAELEAEVANLQSKIIELEQQVAEVELLSALLDFARTQPQNEYQAAAVIGRDPSPFMQYIIINSGSDDGLRRGMPVVVSEGLVGRVAAVTATAARVQLIIDAGSSVNVRLQTAEVDAVLVGSVTSDISLDLIPQDADVQPGDLVLTSGLGGNYPPNILIGQVSSVRQQATDLFQTASVQPVVEFNRLEIVLVIVNFSPVDITPLLPESTP